MKTGKHLCLSSSLATCDKYTMDSNLDKIALDLYGKIQTRFPNIQIGDENAKVLSKKQDIPKARFFEFEYTEGGEPLGTIAITLDADDGIVMQVSGDLVNDDDSTTHHGAYKFIRSFRQFAKDRLLNFDVQNIGKSNLDKRDYEFQAKRKEEPMEPMMESKMYGNAKMSYQDLGEARLVVKHSQPVNTDLAAGRTMHIESIYIENAQGERFRYPFKHLNGARALAEHIKAGGNPYDGIGKHICGLSEELASLRKFKGYVGRQEQLSEAMSDVTSKVMERIDSIKKEITSLQRPTYYQAFAESFQEQEQKAIPEAVMNDWIDRLTIRTFNEELKAVFPYIYNIVDESEVPVKEVGPDDLLAEGTPGMGPFADVTAVYQAALASFGQPGSTGAQGFIQKNQITDPAAIKAVTKAGRDWLAKKGSAPDPMRSPEEQFESFMEDLVSEDQDELFSPNKDAQQAAIEKLNQIMSKELKGGPEGTNAIQSLKGLIDDPEFLTSLKDLDPDLDVRPLIQQFVTANAPEIVAQLNFGGEEGGKAEPEAPAPAPEAPPAPAPEAPPAAPPAPAPAAAAPAPEAPPAAPVAEGKDEDDTPPWDVDPKDKKSKPTKPGKFGQGYSQARHLARQGLADVVKKAKKAGATLETQLDFGEGVMSIAEVLESAGIAPAEVGFEDAMDGYPGMIKFVSGFWNREEGNFPLGGERIKIKVQKEFEDGKFGSASEEDLMRVLAIIDKKDPGGHHEEQNDILRLAGVNKGHADDEIDEAGDDQIAKLNSLMAQFDAMKAMPNAKTSHTSSGSINGQDASYDDAMNKFKTMKLKFGDDELDFSNPDQAGEKMKGIMGGMMKGMQGQVPNQTVQFPGGQMNPADMMKGIMDKINFGK